ncbi:nucleoside-diphosphate-sugar epimerase [Streptomyces griseochromogenes]|uniref:3-beta hydroxysteroid dehydrogenase n=1 Tax=Streptomyces griseochromogenes TaxID=68214 RepID=A0A1B1AXP3_9ACTN|nr:SDR family oxidoreductase [Streptomyces griseochromogenes]ANP51356.1 3-beta hydroxysteroid dehydrogenase [Streptomyces griseochromogenes]MBP2049928.1 nucleoside-diphosphate-sugar epimerase [Streptomyces griseochromogenes]
MRIFVTGASGWIGSAVVPELLQAGHEAVALARSDASVDALKAAGAEVHRGSLDDLDALRDAAAASDGVIHLAFKHEEAFSGDPAAAADADRRAIDTFGQALTGSDRPLVIASGLAGLRPGRLATEDDVPDAALPGGGRTLSERAVLALADRGVRSCSIRLPPTVHGDGDHGFIATLVGTARKHGTSGYIGDGANHWPAVHRLDAARLFRLAVEGAPAGSVLHGVAEERVPTRAIAEAIGRGLGLSAVSVAPGAAAQEYFGWIALLFGLDVRASSTHTQELLGWHPTHQRLIEDLNEGHYFNGN